MDTAAVEKVTTYVAGALVAALLLWVVRFVVGKNILDRLDSIAVEHKSFAATMAEKLNAIAVAQTDHAGRLAMGNLTFDHMRKELHRTQQDVEELRRQVRELESRG